MPTGKWVNRSSNSGLKKIEALPVGERQVSGNRCLWCLTDDGSATSSLAKGIALLDEVVLKGVNLRRGPEGVGLPEPVLSNEQVVRKTGHPPGGVTTNEDFGLE